MSIWKSDTELFALCRAELYTAVVGDIMDKLNYRSQFLPPQIRPLSPTMTTVGRAMPVLEADVFEENPGRNAILTRPFGLMLEALDDLRADEIYICTGASAEYALWGELMSARASQCGAAGAILDGFSRDTNGVLALGLPVFSHGPYAQDQAPRGRVIDFRVRLRIGGVTVRPGDILFGDIDGVCVVPRDMEEEVFSRALEKTRGEKTVLKAIQSGMTACEAFQTYGIM